MSQCKSSARRANRANQPEADRRACRRYIAPPLFCEVLTGVSSSASVLDLSVCGLLLVLENRVEAGDVFPLRLSNRRQLQSCEVWLRVTWCRQQGTGWQFAGGVFVEPMPQGDLSALLG